MSIFPLMTIMLIVTCSSAPAQFSEQFGRCMDKVSSQREMNVCAGEEDDRADAELEREYRNLLSVFKDDKGIVEKIRVAQRTWEIYRDATLAAKYPAENKQAAYGTMFPTDYSLFRAGLTYRQLETLKSMLSR